MRSTITLYFAGSPMRVPPSFTNSATTPSFLPSSFTRTINAGGKLYSRPQRRPIFFIFAFSCQEAVELGSVIPSIHGGRRGSARLGHAGAGLRNQMAHDRFRVSCFAIDAELAVRAGAFLQDGVDVFDGAAASQVIHYVVHQLQQFRNQLPHVHFRFFSEVNQLAIDAVARRAPFIFLDERPAIEPPALVPCV